MVLVCAGLHHIFKTICAAALVVICIATFFISYAYISGDRTDRAEMQQTARHYANYFRVLPSAHASVEPASRRGLASE